MFKVLFFLAIIFGIIWFFFLRKPTPTKKPNSSEETMVECHQCKTFISQQEAILSNGKYYCSQNCLLKG